MRIAVLFNAEFHQILHALPIAIALATDHSETEVSILAPSDEHFRFVEQYLPDGMRNALRFVKLDSPAWVSAYRALTSDLACMKKAMLTHNKSLLADFDALIVPERTTAFLKKAGLTELQLIHSGHGAGDQERSFNPAIQAFDFVLLSGRKYEKHLLQHGLIRQGHYAVTGYPKFDLLLNRQTPRASETLFGNDLPTLLYAPHFNEKLSSWPGLGRQLIDFISTSKQFNLIFAPHVRLFYPPTWWKRTAFRRYAAAPNILIDLGSDRSNDMSYTNAADIYVGDVSSQVYEFIVRPRPCVFLNAHKVDWAGDPFYLCWKCGPVIERIEQLPTAIQEARADHFREQQERLFRDTFDLADRPSSARAAAAIVEFLKRLL